MSGQRFVDALKRVGYDETHLCPESFDWMFENEAILPFLEWFCDNIQHKNILTDDELKSFDELESSGSGILEGENLNEALKSAQALESSEDLEEEISEETEFMMEEQQSLQDRLETLVTQRNKLSILHTELNHKLSKTDGIEDDRKVKYKRSVEQTHTDNAMLNNSTENIGKSVKEYIELYDLPRDEKDKTVSFVSQLPLDDYHNAENVFTSELTTYTKKQFFEGIAELANGNEKSRYTFLEISDPTALLIKGEPEEVTAGDIKELKRLQAVYPMSEMKRIRAQACQHGLEAAIAHAREKLYRINSQSYAVDTESLRCSLQESQHSLSQLRDLTTEVITRRLSPLMKELGDLHANKILRGDYDLKIARQDYFISKQDQVINQLMLQRSRYEFLSMVFEVEARKHRDAHHLLSTVQSLLEEDAKASEKRHSIMMNPLLNKDRENRETIDVRDLFLTRLYEMLTEPVDDAQKPSLFITYDSLREKTEELKNELMTARSDLSSANNFQDEMVAKLEKNLRVFENLLYHGSTTSGLPQLRTQALSDGLNQLDEILATLEQSIRDVVKDWDSKKRILRGDSLKVLERGLFVSFFTDPNKLKRAVADLTARVEAQVVSVD